MTIDTVCGASCIAVAVFLLFIIKNISQFKKSTGSKKIPLKFCLFLLAYMLVIPAGIIMLLFCSLSRLLIGLILKIKLGHKFGGLLEGADAFHTVEGSKTVINILVIFEYDQRRYSQSPYDTIKEAVSNFYFRDPERFPKFLSTLRKCLGYSYLIKNDVTLKDCVKEMTDTQKNTNEKLDKTEVLRLVTHCTNLPLPKNRTVLWDVFIGTQPVNWSCEPDNGKTSYALLFRVHHGIADGVSLLKFMVGALADNPKLKIISPESWRQQMQSRYEEFVDSHNINNNNSQKNKITTILKLQIMYIYKRWLSIMETLATTVYVLFLGPTTVYTQTLIKANDRNSLHGSKLSGQLVLAMKSEISKIYVGKVKRIKDKIPGTAFPEVILTAFAASLGEYFEKNSLPTPRCITAVIPVLPGSSKLQELTPEKLNIDMSLNNKYSLFFLNLPLRITAEDDFQEVSPLIRRLKLIQKETALVKKSIDFVVNYWILGIASAMFPHGVSKMILNLIRCTSFISILPGPPKVTFCGGSPVENVAFWVPHMGHTGVSLSALTYDGRLDIGLNIDKALVSDEKEAHAIVDRIYKCIDEMEEEIGIK